MDLVALTERERLAETIAAPLAEAHGLVLVRVRIYEGGAPRLQIMADRPDGGIDLDDCETLARALEPALEEAAPHLAEHALEVSSPGVDRPLTRTADFRDRVGEEVKVELAEPLDGRRRFRGTLLGLRDDETALLRVADGEVEVPLSRVARAKLVVSPPSGGGTATP